MTRHVFISHSSEDRKVADEICNLIESRGLKCWIAPRDVTPGKEYASEIVDAINSAGAMVLVLTEHANASQFVSREVERAVTREKAVIPIRLREVHPAKSLELYISSAHWIDAFSSPLEAKIEQLVAALRPLCDGVTPPPRASSNTKPFQTAKPKAADLQSKAKLVAIAAAIGIIASVIFALAFKASESNELASSPIEAAKKENESEQAATEPASAGRNIEVENGPTATSQSSDLQPISTPAGLTKNAAGLTRPSEDIPVQPAIYSSDARMVPSSILRIEAQQGKTGTGWNWDDQIYAALSETVDSSPPSAARIAIEGIRAENKSSGAWPSRNDRVRIWRTGYFQITTSGRHTFTLRVDGAADECRAYIPANGELIMTIEWANREPISTFKELALGQGWHSLALACTTRGNTAALSASVSMRTQGEPLTMISLSMPVE